MDLYCKNLTCPICGTTDEDSQPYDFICLKGCYEVVSVSGWEDAKGFVGDQFTIFGEFIEIRGSESKDIIEEKIKYWKENDRYLTEWLGR